MGQCPECKDFTTLNHHGLCQDCYREMFYEHIKVEPKKEEPEFELKSEVATIRATGDGTLYMTGASTLAFPKYYVFNPDARVKDYEKLVEFILANMIVTDQSPDFKKISWMFKEVEK